MRNGAGTHCRCYCKAPFSEEAPQAARLRLGVGALALALSSCASVQSVTVAPSTACAGDPIRVSWVASGTTEVAVVPLDAAAARPSMAAEDFCVDALASGLKPNPEPSRGSVALRASVDTAFLVQAQGWFGKPAHRCARLFVNQVLPLSDVPECVSGATGGELRAAQVHLIRPNGSRWSTTATTGVVENDNSVAVAVRHAGKSISLPAGGRTDLFTGTDPNADWWVEYTWSEGPRCGNVGAPVPNSLSLEIHPLCSRPSGAGSSHR